MILMRTRARFAFQLVVLLTVSLAVCGCQTVSMDSMADPITLVKVTVGEEKGGKEFEVDTAKASVVAEKGIVKWESTVPIEIFYKPSLGLGTKPRCNADSTECWSRKFKKKGVKSYVVEYGIKSKNGTVPTLDPEIEVLEAQ